MDDAIAVDALRPLAQNAKVMGGSSSRGVLSCSGLGSVGVLGFRGFCRHAVIGSAAGANGVSAREAGVHAARAACNGDVPDMFFICTAPGSEEDVLEGIHDVCGPVPVFGGSSADESIRTGDSVEAWWQLFGDGCGGWGSHHDGVVLAAVWLWKDARMACSLSHCSAPQNKEGIITSAEGRILHEIDGRPAATVLDEWMDGALGEAKNGGCIVDKMAGHPLATPLAIQTDDADEQAVPMKLVHARSVLPSGGIECFSRLTQGFDVHLLQAKASDISGAAVQLAREAVACADFPVKGGLFIFSAAGCARIPDLSVMTAAICKELPNYMCILTFGQQGMIGRTPRHGNLMMNVALFG